MRALKFTFIFVSLLVYLILGGLLRLAMFWAKPQTTIKSLNFLKYYLMHTFRLIANIKVSIKGEKDVLKGNGLFIICTHIGYLDGVILGSLTRGSFTTKSEIKKVPFLGMVVAIGGSIFIDRKKKSDIIHYVNIMSERLGQEINVFNFPEGHATNGEKILSFFPAFFDAPLKAKSTIVPITINYTKVNGSSTFDKKLVYHYDGNGSIFKHLWKLMSLKRLDIEVTIHEKIQPNGYSSNAKDRKLISDLCMKRLSKYKNLPVSKHHPLKRPQIETIPFKLPMKTKV